MYCSPRVNKNDKSRYDINQLRKIASAYNSRNGKNKISISGKTKNELWEAIRSRLSNEGCDDSLKYELCWIQKLDLANNSDLLERFRPVGPKGQKAWLSTSDINSVMKQYEDAYSGFIFFGPVPIDFATINTELNNLDLYALVRRDIKSVGIVFNMDPHDQGGSHWVCMFIDLKRWNILYFDSFGICPPPQEVVKLIKSINNAAIEISGREMVVKCNKIQHQLQNAECGVYCIYFIVESLKGRSFDNICKSIILDDEINQYRKLFFRPS